MIVRILGEGQWDVDDGELDRLNELDDKLEHAVAEGDESTFRTSLDGLLAAVRKVGAQVGVEELVDSDLILPMSDATLDEVKHMLADDGLIPG
ncbi:MAG: hypothetical protein GEU93_14915 [Propionibacteriales bacterium]|nr:hypothetical protein [Propionibacteriales bacterium]